MTAVQPCSKRKNDENRGISQNADEEKYACWPKSVNSNLEGGEMIDLPRRGYFFPR